MSTVEDQQAADDAAAAAVAAVVSPEEAAELAAAIDTAWLDPAAGIDFARPYGQVHDGSGVSKARYQQDGKFYDHLGALVKE